jgi:hypothetical protein
LIVRKSITSIVALADKAEEFRRIVRDLGFSHTESAVPDEPGVISWTCPVSVDSFPSSSLLVG